MRRPSQQGGFTLVEMVVVIVILSVIMGAVGMLWTRGQAHTRQVEQHLTTERNARVALDAIARDVRVGTLAPVTNPSTPSTDLMLADADPEASPTVYRVVDIDGIPALVREVGDQRVVMVSDVVRFKISFLREGADVLPAEARSITVDIGVERTIGELGFRRSFRRSFALRRDL